MNALRLATKAAIAPARAQSRTMVSRTAPALGQQDPFEHVRASHHARKPYRIQRSLMLRVGLQHIVIY